MKLPAFLATALLTTAAFCAEISPSDPMLVYVGRFDTTKPEAPVCSWQNSTVAFTLSGGSAEVSFDEKGSSYWQVAINGQPSSVLKLEKGTHTYHVAKDLPAGKHRIELVKRTEASLGYTAFLGLEISDHAKLLPTAARPKRIEVIGDSITCGYGNEAANKEEKFTPATENAWLSYGAIAARDLNADYVSIAFSGKKLWPNNTITELYDLTLTFSPEPKWDFSKWIPDVVVINLGTNDFGQQNPEQEGWVAAYVAFITRIRSHYPDAPVYCALGTMMSDWPADRKPRTTILGYLAKVLEQSNTPGAPPVRIIDFGTQAQHNGIGAQWHPSVKTHRIMAEKLTATLKADLDWE